MLSGRKSRLRCIPLLVVVALGACGSEDEKPPKQARGGDCAISDDCTSGLICVDSKCSEALTGAAGDSGDAGGATGFGAAGESGLPVIQLTGAGGQLGEDACVEICDAARHCPGVNPKYECEASCTSSEGLVSTTGCEGAWDHVLRCTVNRGPCAACQNELTELYDCVRAYCDDHEGSTYCMN